MGRTLLHVLALLALLTAIVPAAQTQAQAAPLYGLAIDLSGSTCCTDNPPPTDHDCLAISAARMYLDLLRPASVVLIPFHGAAAEVDGPYDLGNPSQVSAAQRRLKDMCAERGGETPLADAIDKATQQFSDNHAARDSRLLVFTDGAPTPPDNQDHPTSEEQYDHIFKDKLPTWRDNGWHIDTVGLTGSNQGEAQRFLPRLQQMAGETGGSYDVASSPQQLATIFLKAFTQIRGDTPQDLTQAAGDTLSPNGWVHKVTLDPSVREMIVVVFRDSNKTSVELTGPGGPLKETDPRLQVYSHDDPHYWLASLAAQGSNLGRDWTVSVHGSGWFKAVYLYKSDLALHLVKPASGELLPAGPRAEGEPASAIVVQLLANGQVAPAAAQVSGTLKPDNGAPIVLTFHDDGQPGSCDAQKDDGQFSSCLPADPQAGAYQLDVAASVGEKTVRMPQSIISIADYPHLEWLSLDPITTLRGSWPREVPLARLKTDDLQFVKLDSVQVTWLTDDGNTPLAHHEIPPSAILTNGGVITDSLNAPEIAAQQGVALTPTTRNDGTRVLKTDLLPEIELVGEYHGNPFRFRSRPDHSLQATTTAAALPSIEWIKQAPLQVKADQWPQSLTIARVRADQPDAVTLDRVEAEWYADREGKTLLARDEVPANRVVLRSGELQISVSYDALSVAGKQAPDNLDSQTDADGNQIITTTHYLKLSIAGIYGKERFGPITELDQNPVQSVTSKQMPLWQLVLQRVLGFVTAYWTWGAGIVAGVLALLVLLLMVRKIVAWTRERLADYPYPEGWLSWGPERDPQENQANLTSSLHKIALLSRLGPHPTLPGSAIDRDLAGLAFRVWWNRERGSQVRYNGHWQDLRPNPDLSYQLGATFVTYSIGEPESKAVPPAKQSPQVQIQPVPGTGPPPRSKLPAQRPLGPGGSRPSGSLGRPSGIRPMTGAAPRRGPGLARSIPAAPQRMPAGTARPLPAAPRSMPLGSLRPLGRPPGLTPGRGGPGISPRPTGLASGRGRR